MRKFLKSESKLDWKPGPGGKCTECDTTAATLWYGIERAESEDPIVAKSVCWGCVGRIESELSDE